MQDDRETTESVARRFGVSKSVVDKRASQESWHAQRKAQKAISGAIAKRIEEEVGEAVPTQAVRIKYAELGDIYLDSAIRELHHHAPLSQLRSKEAAYSTQVKLIQLKLQMPIMEAELELKKLELKIKKCDLELKRRQLRPPTPAEWAEVAIAQFGLDPVELWAKVKEVWSKQAS